MKDASPNGGDTTNWWRLKACTRSCIKCSCLKRNWTGVDGRHSARPCPIQRVLPATGTGIMAADRNNKEPRGKGYDWRLMRRLLPYLRPHKWTVAASLALATLTAPLLLAGPPL